jgi:Acyl-CoA reductase (LuxC)
MLSDEEQWTSVKDSAMHANPWFTAEHIELAVHNIAHEFLDKDKLTAWVGNYLLPQRTRKVGMVMAGNIPLVGFHDFLCGYLSGHLLHLKLSAKDELLLKHLINILAGWDATIADHVHIQDRLNGCEAYIATGSNNTARYFEQYFAAFPHIIRKNRTSVAILDGSETADELDGLARDVFSYYGLGCRNVSKIHVPYDYDFTKLLPALGAYERLMGLHKYKNNYDYYLAIYLLNRVPYLTNGSVLLVENEVPFSGVSVIHYQYYRDKDALIAELRGSEEIQSIVGRGFTPFGTSQRPALSDYADGVDTMAFLCSL